MLLGSSRRISPNLLELYLCFSSQEVGIQEQAGNTQSGKLAAGEFAHPRLLYA